MVDQAIPLTALEHQLDLLESLLLWDVPLVLAMTYVGLARQSSFDLAGLRVARQDAFALAALIAGVLQIGAALVLARIASLLVMYDEGNARAAFQTLTLHSSPITPFAFYGGDLFARAHSAASYFLYLMVLAGCFFPMTLFPAQRRLTILASLALAFTGTLSAWLTWKTLNIAARSIAAIDSGMSQAFTATFLEKTVCLLGVMWVNLLLARVVRGSQR